MDIHLEKNDRTSEVSSRARMITGALLVIIISSFVLGGGLAFLFLIFCINQLALLEYQKMIEMHGFHLQKASVHLASFILLVVTYLVAKLILQSSVFILLPLLVPLILSIELFRKKKFPIENVALTIVGLIWISLPFCLFMFVGYLPLGPAQYDPHISLGYFLILWFGDSGAYFAGKKVGKRKLFKRISPNKTWEGFAGGFAAAVMAGIIDFVLFHQLALNQWLLLASIIYVTGTFGDFAKSMLKRSVGVKDSGNLLPGHGGIIDRFDSLIGSAPFAFLYLMFYA